MEAASVWNSSRIAQPGITASRDEFGNHRASVLMEVITGEESRGRAVLHDPRGCAT